jgi:hypothetical protein
MEKLRSVSKKTTRPLFHFIMEKVFNNNQHFSTHFKKMNQSELKPYAPMEIEMLVMNGCFMVLLLTSLELRKKLSKQFILKSFKRIKH